MQNPFQSVSTPNKIEEKLENIVNFDKYVDTLRQTLSVAALVLASSFGTPTAKANDGVNALESTQSIEKLEDRNEDLDKVILEAKNLCKKIENDAELMNCIQEAEQLMPEIDYLPESEKDSFFDLDSEAKIPKALNLTLPAEVIKRLSKEASDNDMLRNKIKPMSALLESAKYDKTFKDFEENIKFLDPLFKSRPTWKLENNKTETNVKAITDTGIEYTDRTVLESTDYKVIPKNGLNNGEKKYQVGNKEIYTVMNALLPLGKEVGQILAKSIGCSPHEVTSKVDLYSSVHINDEGNVSPVPYNNVHPTYTIEGCREGAVGDTTNNLFISVFNNSNGHGAPNLNELKNKKTITTKPYEIDGNIYTSEKRKGATAINFNRMIVTAGIRYDIPIGSTNINFSPRLGFQYGYSLGRNKGKLSPMAMLTFVYKKEGSALDGLEIGILPGRKGVDSALTWSSTIKIKF